MQKTVKKKKKRLRFGVWGLDLKVIVGHLFIYSQSCSLNGYLSDIRCRPVIVLDAGNTTVDKEAKFLLPWN